MKLVKMLFVSIWIKIILFFGYKKDESVIPKDTVYCYVDDDEKNAKETDFVCHIKPCKYYCSDHKTGYTLCKFDGTFGFDPLLADQCKICGINEDIKLK